MDTILKKDTLKKQSLFPKRLSLSLLKEAITPLLLWATLSFSLLFATLTLSFISSLVVTYYLAFFTFFGVLATLYGRTLGLSCVYCALAIFLISTLGNLAYIERLWHMGSILSVALTLYIVLLTVEEIETSFVSRDEKIDSLSHELQQMLTFSQELETRGLKEQQQFNEEIERLKQEAELRKIENAQLTQHRLLVEGEIELLTTQKEEWISYGKAAEASEKRHRQKVEEILSEKEILATLLDEQVNLFEKEKQQLLLLKEREFRDIHKENTLAHQKHILTLQTQIHILVAQSKAFEANFRTLHKESTCRYQEIVLSFQGRTLNSPEIETLRKRVRGSEGAYKQLRSQFEEKSALLNQTRKDLFHTQEVILRKDRELAESELIATQSEELQRLIAELVKLEEERADHEHSLIILEDLITYIMTYTNSEK